MKKRIILTALLMLMCSQIFSQEDTVKLPFSIAKKIALDLAEKDRLTAVNSVNTLIISNLKQQVTALEDISSKKSSQILLLHNTIKIWEAQYNAEKNKKKNSGWLIWALAVLAAGGTGYVAGSL